MNRVFIHNHELYYENEGFFFVNGERDGGLLDGVWQKRDWNFHNRINKKNQSHHL